MKKKIMLIALMAALFVCVFALSVSASGSASDGYGDLTVVDGVAEPSVIDKDARTVILGNDGLYYTVPTYYIIADNATFTWKQNTALNELIGYPTLSAQGMRSYVVRMEIPEGITGINPNNSGGATALEDAKKLIEATLPSSLTKIGNYAFNRCTSLTTLNGFESYLERATSIGTLMMASTAWGEGINLVIPEAITSLPESCFQNTKISSVTFHSSFTTIGPRAFQGCTNITSVTLPSSLVTLKNHTFASCSSLVSIDVSACTGLKEIGDYSFEYTKITGFDFTPFASTMETIGVGLFNGCSKMTSVTSYELVECATAVGASMFNGCPLTEIKMPKNITSIGNKAFYQHMSTQAELRIPNGVLSIGDHAFARYSSGGNGAKIYLSADLKTIANDYTFENWNYSEMYIPSGLELFARGACNKTLQKGVVYFYTGELNGLKIDATNNAAILNATWISAAEFTGASSECNYVVYGYNVCDAFYDDHQWKGEDKAQLNSYFVEICVSDSCSRCNKNDVKASIPALFESKGVSAKTFGEDIALVQGYGVNLDAINAYKAYVTDFDFGILAYANSGKTEVTPKPGDDKVVDIVFDNMVNDYIEVKLTGIPSEYQDTPLVFCIYATEGDKFYYLDDGAMTESIVGKSYNDIID